VETARWVRIPAGWRAVWKPGNQTGIQGFLILAG